jgi:hypothetical protein
MLGNLTKEQIEELLHTQGLGRIGCHVNEQTYVVPVSFAYDGESVICHSAEGKKIKMMRDNPQVCFEVDHVTNMANWQSVIAWGMYEELHGEDAIKGMQALMDKFMRASISQTIHAGPAPASEHGAGRVVKAVVYKIHLKEKTGRFEVNVQQ